METERTFNAGFVVATRSPPACRSDRRLGNKLYDAGRYAEAVPYYQQALAIDANNAELSTDLGTAAVMRRLIH